jgi:hypothetical protein
MLSFRIDARQRRTMVRALLVAAGMSTFWVLSR